MGASGLHEALVELFRLRPALAAELLDSILGVPLPPYDNASMEPGDLTDLVPTEYRADAVVVLSARGRPVLAVILEVQLRRDNTKRWSWPVYLATLRARLRCPVAVLVVCPRPSVAAWAATVVDLGPGTRMQPLVLGPDRIPVLTDPIAAAAQPDLSALSALAHGAGPAHKAVLDAFVAALAGTDAAHGTLYTELVAVALPPAARAYLEDLMTTSTYEYRSFVRKYVLKGREEGRAEAAAESVLAVLDARGVTVPDDARARISTCTDLGQLQTWLRLAATAADLAELHLDTPQP